MMLLKVGEVFKYIDKGSIASVNKRGDGAALSTTSI